MVDVSITDYHAKPFSHLLTRQVNGDEPDRFTWLIIDLSVVLNSHQIDAALFAFQSPSSSEVLLADEVGLGKTIEAGLVISQPWAERARSIVSSPYSDNVKSWDEVVRSLE